MRRTYPMRPGRETASGRAVIDRAAMQFLAEAENAGIRIVNCPEYVRSWIAAENEGQTKE
jgi:hypothetical protein